MHNLFWSLLVLFLIAALLRMDWVYYLVYVVGGIWIFSHWWIGRSLGKLTVGREMLDHAFVGEHIPVRVRVRNSSWLPLPWLLIEDRVPLDLKDTPEYRYILTVGSRGVTDHQFALYCKRRGYYTVGPLALNTGDLFGFAEAAWQEARPIHVTVYPQIVPLYKLGLPSRSPFGVLPSRQRLFEDPNRMAGVREYVTGDSQRRIHWKASAHENTLLVKKFQPAIALNITVVLDLNRNAYPYLAAVGSSEWAIVVAASVASYASEQRQSIGLICNGLDSLTEEPAAAIPAHNGQAHLMSILSLLARVQLRDGPAPLADWLPRQIADLEWGTTLVVVTPRLTDQGLWVLHNAHRRGSNVVVMLCASQTDYDTVRVRARDLGVHVHRTIWEKDLESLDVSAA